MNDQEIIDEAWAILHGIKKQLPIEQNTCSVPVRNPHWVEEILKGKPNGIPHTDAPSFSYLVTFEKKSKYGRWEFIRIESGPVINI